MNHKHSTAHAAPLNRFPELTPAIPAGEFRSDPPQTVPGSLQIEIIGDTGIPVLSPLPNR
jgi:hypothetical protein